MFYNLTEGQRTRLLKETAALAYAVVHTHVLETTYKIFQVEMIEGQGEEVNKKRLEMAKAQTAFAQKVLDIVEKQKRLFIANNPDEIFSLGEGWITAAKKENQEKRRQSTLRAVYRAARRLEASTVGDPIVPRMMVLAHQQTFVPMNLSASTLETMVYLVGGAMTYEQARRQYLNWLQNETREQAFATADGLLDVAFAKTYLDRESANVPNEEAFFRLKEISDWIKIGLVFHFDNSWNKMTPSAAMLMAPQARSSWEIFPATLGIIGTTFFGMKPGDPLPGDAKMYETFMESDMRTSYPILDVEINYEGSSMPFSKAVVLATKDPAAARNLEKTIGSLFDQAVVKMSDTIEKLVEKYARATDIAELRTVMEGSRFQESLLAAFPRLKYLVTDFNVKGQLPNEWQLLVREPADRLLRLGFWSGIAAWRLQSTALNKTVEVVEQGGTLVAKGNYAYAAHLARYKFFALAPFVTETGSAAMFATMAGYTSSGLARAFTGLPDLQDAQALFRSSIDQSRFYAYQDYTRKKLLFQAAMIDVAVQLVIVGTIYRSRINQQIDGNKLNDSFARFQRDGYAQRDLGLIEGDWNVARIQGRYEELIKPYPANQIPAKYKDAYNHLMESINRNGGKAPWSRERISSGNTSIMTAEEKSIYQSLKWNIVQEQKVAWETAVKQ